MNNPQSASARKRIDPSANENPPSGVHAKPEDARAAAAPYPSSSQAWYTVLVLMVMYIFSFIDRQILSMLVSPMKRDLQISDTQVGLLQGIAFAILYTVLGLPIGRLADRTSRKGIIAAGVLIWSVMATACGFARSAVQLFLARVGVGVGEAALGPAAYSMITDSFPREKLGRAFSVYNMGIPLGSGVALLVGGLIVGSVSGESNITLPLLGTVRSWQLVFIVTGAPGLLLPLLLLSVREPVRRGLLKTAAKSNTVPLAEVLRYVIRHRSFYLPHFLAMALMAMVGYGVNGWMPEMLHRTYGVSVADAGKFMGLDVLVFNTAGIFIAGRVCDRMTAKGRKDAPMRVSLIAVVFVLVTSLLTPFMPSVPLMWGALALAILPFNAYNGMGPMAVNQVTPNQLRGQVSAIYLFFVNIIGMGLGPYVVPAFSDKILHDPSQLRWGMAVVVVFGCTTAWALLAYARPRYLKRLAEAETWA